MTMIDCPACGRGVSPMASTCPECGHPIATHVVATPGFKSEPTELVAVRTSMSVFARMALALLLLTGGWDPSETAIVAGAVVGLSVLPALFRGRQDWLRAKSSATTRSGVAERMAALEQACHQRMDEVEDAHAAHVADIEERLEVAERLLTKKPAATPVP